MVHKILVVELEIEELNNRIQFDEEISEERWDAYLNADPVKHVQDIQWVDEDSCALGGCVGIPLVTIAGITGTICADNADENTLDFLCQKLSGVNWATGNTRDPLSHVDSELAGFPVLLNNLQCIEGATSVEDCTSGPMGFEHCESEQDLQLGCMWGAPPNE